MILYGFTYSTATQYLQFGLTRMILGIFFSPRIMHLFLAPGVLMPFPQLFADLWQISCEQPAFQNPVVGPLPPAVFSSNPRQK